jgi:hypothetical protein
MVLAGAVVSQAAIAGPNANTTLVLHAVQTGYGTCDLADPCAGPGQPTVEITSPAETHAIYVIARNYEGIDGVQCAFDWDDWILLFHHEQCLPQQLGSDSGPIGPGSLYGNMTTTFDCITGGASAIVSRLHMIPNQGCLEIIESSFPFGTHVMGCDVSFEAVAPENRGKICVGPGGMNTCEPAFPVEAATWGGIKGQYR